MRSKEDVYEKTRDLGTNDSHHAIDDGLLE